MKLTVSHDFLPHRNSTRASVVMDHFGIGFEQGRHLIAEDLELPIRPGMVVLFTGASGSGKSSLLRAAVEQFRQPSESDRTSQERVPQVVSLDDLQLPDELLIDALNLPVEQGLNLLAACGLGEAQLMLRRPAELSEGQRYRFRLAFALAQRPDWVVADEFTATLDRTLAQVISFNLRRMADRTGTGFLLATTHEDVAHDLAPDLQVHCRLDGHIEVRQTAGEEERSTQQSASHAKRSGLLTLDSGLSPPDSGLKKKRSPSPTSSGSPPRPDATGRTLLGGITAATISASPGS